MAKVSVGSSRIGLLKKAAALRDQLTGDEAYSRIMFFSPESVSRSNITATGLDSYEGPIAETIEYKEDNGPEGVPVLDNADMSMDMMDLNYDLTPLYQTEYGDSLYPTGYNYNLEGTTTKKLGYTPRYENNAMLQLKAKNALIQLQQKFFDLHGKNFEIESAYRNKEHDAAVGGKDKNHPKGNAFDVKFSLLSDKEKYDLKILGKAVGLHWANYPGSSHFNYR